MTNPITLDLSGVILPDDWISDPWGDVRYPFGGISLARVQSEYENARASLNADPDGIVLFLNTDGGVIEEGFAIYDYLLSLGLPITTIGIGGVYSMGSILLLAGETRMLAAHAKLMIHLPGFGMESYGITGNKHDLQEAIDILVAEEARILSVYSEKTGKAESDLAAIMADGKNHFFTAPEALAYGFTTGIYQQQSQLTTALNRNRVPVMAHLSEGREKFNLPAKTPKPQATTPTPPTAKPNNPIMSSLKERATRAIAAFESLLTGAPVNVLSVTTADGKELEIDNAGDTYAVNDTVKYKDGTDLPDGDYVLSDNNTITVVAMVITAIVEPVTTATIDEASNTVTISKEEFDRLKALEPAVTNLQTSVTTMQGSLTAMQAEQTKSRDAMATALDVLRGIESADPITVVAMETNVDRRIPADDDDAVERKKQRQAAAKK